MLTARGKLSLLALAPCLAFLAFTSREGRAQEGKAVPTDVRVVNPNTAPVFASVVNSASAPVQAKIVNALGAPVPANIINPATTPVQAKIVNGPASPVQTSLVGSPIVGAKQNGTWNVNVANPATAPVRTRDANDTGIVFSRALDVPFESGQAAAVGQIPMPATAAGQLLLIEHVSIFGYLPADQSLAYALVKTVTSEGASFFVTQNALPITYPLSDNVNSHYFAAAQVTHLYHNPSSALGVTLARSSGANTGGATVAVHGRIIRQ